MAKQCVTYLQKKVHWTDTVTIATKLRRFPNVFNQKKTNSECQRKEKRSKVCQILHRSCDIFSDTWQMRRILFDCAFCLLFLRPAGIVFSQTKNEQKKTTNSKSNSCLDAWLLVACAVVFVYYLFCLWLFRFFDIFIANIRKTQISSKLLIAPVLLSVISSLFQAFCLPETTSPSYKNSL